MPATSADKTPIAHPASTVILLRPAEDNFEVLLLLRAKAIKFAGGAWVFPGGRIDPQDGQIAETDNLDSYTAASIAAARESEEEAGLTLNPESFVEYSHWTTPVAEKKRFSTWFLLGHVDRNCPVTVDDGEIVEYQWLTPQAAIDKHHGKALKILPPTYLTLLELAKFGNIDDVRQFATERSAPRFFPNMVFHDKTVSVLYQDDSGYATGNPLAKGKQHRMTMIDDCWHYIRPS